VPWVLGATFALSFFWDFDDLAFQITGYTLTLIDGGTIVRTWTFAWLPLPADLSAAQSLENLLLITATSGLIGFLTNWLAVVMLFRPRSRRPIFGHGLVPAQRDRVILRLAESIDSELINPEVIARGIQDNQVISRFLEGAQQVLRDLLADEEFREEIRSVVHAYVEQIISSDDFRQEIVSFIFKGLEDRFSKGVGGQVIKPLLQLTEGPLRAAVNKAIQETPQGLDLVFRKLDPAIDKIPDQVAAHADEIEAWVTDIVQRFVDTLDIRSMLITQMQAFDDRRLEDLIRRSSNDQINYIKYLGGILGFVGGFLIFNPWLALPGFAVLILLLIGADYAIKTLSRRAAPQSG